MNHNDNVPNARVPRDIQPGVAEREDQMVNPGQILGAPAVQVPPHIQAAPAGPIQPARPLTVADLGVDQWNQILCSSNLQHVLELMKQPNTVLTKLIIFSDNDYYVFQVLFTANDGDMTLIITGGSSIHPPCLPGVRGSLISALVDKTTSLSSSCAGELP
jgi:hypothetical protein